MEIIPAVLAKDYEEMKDKIALVRGIVPMVQIDLCDGVFVGNKTWPFSTGGTDDVKFKSILNETLLDISLSSISFNMTFLE